MKPCRPVMKIKNPYYVFSVKRLNFRVVFLLFFKGANKK
jgi:hypothetical protein